MCSCVCVSVCRALSCIAPCTVLCSADQKTSRIALHFLRSVSSRFSLLSSCLAFLNARARACVCVPVHVRGVWGRVCMRLRVRAPSTSVGTARARHGLALLPNAAVRWMSGGEGRLCALCEGASGGLSEGSTAGRSGPDPQSAHVAALRDRVGPPPALQVRFPSSPWIAQCVPLPMPRASS